MKYSVQAFNGGTFWVPGPEVYWMQPGISVRK